jgi:hypothetical protein
MPNLTPNSPLQADDLPPEPFDPQDLNWQKELANCAGKYFFQGCSGSLQALLMICQWRFSRDLNNWVLKIESLDAGTTERIHNSLKPLAQQLADFSATAHLQLYPKGADQALLDIPVHQWLSLQDIS